MKNLYFDYRVTGGDENILPVRVVDGGKKTFIQMPAGMAVREAPVLVVLGPEGKPEMVNYRVKGDLYIVDRLFERGALLLGVGKKQRRADIIRGTYRSRNKKADSRELSRSLGQSQGVNKD
ncbi:MAG: TrbG/VirB9 family P-type conjugative transfer protein [Bryobacteraceae bacterium]